MMRTGISPTRVIQAAVLLAAVWATQAACGQAATKNAIGVAPTAVPTGAKLPAGAGSIGTAEAGKAARDLGQVANPGKLGGEGVTIHGHWVIDVRNPDGTLVEHRDFENSLVTVGALVSGDQLLAGLLTGNLSVGDPAIGFVQGPLGSDPSVYCKTVANVTTSTTCYGLTTAASGLANFLSNFTVGLNSSYTFGTSVSWELKGAYTTPSTLKSISAVQTLVTVCASLSVPFLGDVPGEFQKGTWSGRTDIVAPINCNPQPGTAGIGTNGYRVYSTLTSTKLATPLTVSTGQIIAATVTISFS